MRGTSLSGEPVAKPFRGLTLVVAIKPECDGCRDFVESALNEFRDLDVVLVASRDEMNDEWRHARHEIIVAPDFLVELDVRWPPFYVLLDATTRRVLVEGVVFGPAQVAEEIRPYVTP
jgi:hypothetical protein